MINPFTVKKWGALLLTGLLTTISFFIGISFYNFIYALIFMGLGLIISALIANSLLQNPFSLMLEGKGVLALNLDSTGVIRPFIMSVKSPYVEGMLNNSLKSDVFDRDTVLNLAAPQEAGIVQQGRGKDGKVRIALVLNEDDYNKGRFALFHYPTIIFNEQINSIITKDFLSNEEKTAFAEHGVLYLNRKMEELTSAIRDFGRHVVENLKPKGFNISSGWVIGIVVVVLIILLIMFAPNIMEAMGIASGSVGEGITNAAGAVQKVK
jgi:hypothetical protein